MFSENATKGEPVEGRKEIRGQKRLPQGIASKAPTAKNSRQNLGLGRGRLTG